MPTLEEIAKQQESIGPSDKKRSSGRLQSTPYGFTGKGTLEEIAGMAASRPAVSTAADVQAYSQEEMDKLNERSFAAEKALQEAKHGVFRHGLPVAAGMLTAPLTAGLSMPVAMLAQAGVGAASEYAGQKLSGEDLDTSEIAWEGILGGLLEGGTRGLAYGWKAATGHLPMNLSKKNMNVFDAVARTKASVTKAEVFGGPFARFVQRWTDASTYGRELAEERKLGIADALHQNLEQAFALISKKTSPGRTMAETESLMKVVQGGWNKVAGKRFDEARRLAPQGSIIDLTETVDEARRLLARGDNLRGEMPTVMKSLTAEEKVLEDFLLDAEKIIPAQTIQSALLDASGKQLPGQVIPAQRTVKTLSVEQATELRKLFNEKYYTYLNSGDRAASKMLKDFEVKFDASLSRQVGGPASPYMKKLGEAKQFYKEGYDVWDVSFIAKMLDKDPSKTISALDVKDPFVLEKLQKAFSLHGKHTNVRVGMGIVRRQAVQDLIQESSMSTAGRGIAEAEEVLLRPESLRAGLRKLDTDARNIIFSGPEGKQTLTALNDYILIGDRVNKMQKGAGDRMMGNIAMLMWGAAHQSPAMITAGGANIWFPKFLTHIVNEPLTAEHVKRAMLYAEKGIMNPKNPKYYAAYLQEVGRATEIWRRSRANEEMRQEALGELAAIKQEREKRGIPQRTKPDR